jgi:hypothetical protein
MMASTSLRPILSIAGQQPRLANAHCQFGLNLALGAEVILAEGLAPGTLCRGMAAELDLGGQKLPLELAQFHVARSGAAGGRLLLVDPLARMAPYRAAVFSSDSGASFGQMLRSRIDDFDAPETLMRTKFPTIVADAPVIDVLRDVCARHDGWHFRRGESGALRLGPLEGEATDLYGIDVHDTEDGVVAAVGSPAAPEIGAAVRLGDLSGQVLRYDVTFQAGHEPIWRATVGEPSAPPRLVRRATLRLDGQVQQIDPLIVTIAGTEVPNSRARAVLRGLRGMNVRMSYNLNTGDPVRIELNTGAVCTDLLPAWIDTECPPTTGFELQANRYTGRITEGWDVEAGDIEFRTPQLVTKFTTFIELNAR